jgi:hypothetical protein
MVPATNGQEPTSFGDNAGTGMTMITRFEIITHPAILLIQ